MWLEALAAGSGIIGSLLSGSSKKAASDLQSASYGAQADLALANTDILNTQADTAELGVDFAASRQRLQLGQIMEQGRQTLAAQRSYFAGNHLDPSFGSPLVTQAVTASRIQSDVDMTGVNFEVERANVKSNVATLRGQAAGSAGQALAALYGKAAAEVGGSSAETAGWLGAGTALLKGFSGMSGLSLGGGDGGVASTIQVGSQSFPAYR
ncbi:hypothetical protein VRZ08_05565 [Rhodopseudomonas sp. G2_2311]|uniref:hypothetical protein n=1 Tax=Rhodopseudomonas sp. G2_2311 TaxID=3114287 RepID=UPI0039C67ABD